MKRYTDIEIDIDVDVDVDIDIGVEVDEEVDVNTDRYFGSLKGVPKSAQVLFKIIEAVMVLMVLTLITLK